LKTPIVLYFKKGGGREGTAIVNGLKSYEYRAILPDSILFHFNMGSTFTVKVESQIERLFRRLPDLYQFPMEYTHDSGKYAVPMSSLTEFFDLLKRVMTRYPDKFYISKYDFTSLLTALATANYLTTAQVAHYTEIIPVIYSIDDMERDARTNRDADLALKLARLHREQGDSSSQVYWLDQARDFKPDHPFFTTPGEEKLASESTLPSTVDSLCERWAREPLITQLEAYLERIDAHETTRGNPNFHYGFSFFKNSRALNRHANYLLAEALLHELKGQMPLTTIFDGNKIFSQRQTLIDNSGLRTSDYVERGIRSKELNGIIRAGLKLGQEKAHEHEDVALETRPKRP